jgi:hypothetical protein
VEAAGVGVEAAVVAAVVEGLGEVVVAAAVAGLAEVAGGVTAAAVVVETAGAEVGEVVLEQPTAINKAARTITKAARPMKDDFGLNLLWVFINLL